MYGRIQASSLNQYLILMEGKTIGIIAVIIVIAGGWYLLSRGPASAPQAAPTDQTPVTASSTTTTTTMTTPVPPAGVTVIYSNQGFAPKSVTVPLGTTVTFVNQSSSGMWVASAAHPTHIVYSGTSLSQHCPDTANTSFDACAAVASNNSFSFTFNKVGTWNYHNHTDASKFGTVIVTAAASTATTVTASTTVSVPL